MSEDKVYTLDENYVDKMQKMMDKTLPIVSEENLYIINHSYTLMKDILNTCQELDALGEHDASTLIIDRIKVEIDKLIETKKELKL